MAAHIWKDPEFCGSLLCDPFKDRTSQLTIQAEHLTAAILAQVLRRSMAAGTDK
jgi:hypothetical protein